MRGTVHRNALPRKAAQTPTHDGKEGHYATFTTAACNTVGGNLDSIHFGKGITPKAERVRLTDRV